MTTNSGYFGFESVVVAALAVLAAVMLTALAHAAMNAVVLV